jgi:hypothetical protein
MPRSTDRSGRGSLPAFYNHLASSPPLFRVGLRRVVLHSGPRVLLRFFHLVLYAIFVARFETFSRLVYLCVTPSCQMRECRDPRVGRIGSASAIGKHINSWQTSSFRSECVSQFVDLYVTPSCQMRECRDPRVGRTGSASAIGKHITLSRPHLFGLNA